MGRSSFQRKGGCWSDRTIAAPALGFTPSPQVFLSLRINTTFIVMRIIVPNSDSEAVCVLSYQRNFPIILFARKVDNSLWEGLPS